MTTDCIYCSKAILYPDGRLRCPVDDSLATRFCDSVEEGRPSLYKPQYNQLSIKKTGRKK